MDDEFKANTIKKNWRFYKRQKNLSLQVFLAVPGCPFQ